MKRNRWIEENIPRLDGKRIALTGSTGGLGGALCLLLASRGASLLLLDRNSEKQSARAEELRRAFPDARVECRILDLSDPASVGALDPKEIGALDILIHNAGAYRLPRRVGKWGADAVFETDAIAPLALTKRLLPALKAKGEGCVVLVSSIALSLAKIDENDPDYRTRTSQMKAYGNAKRMATGALLALGRREGITVAIAHPGISGTGITAGYPAFFRRIADSGMKLLFPSPENACLPLALAAVCPPPVGSWCAPCAFGVWGKPATRRLPVPEEEWDKALEILENMI